MCVFCRFLGLDHRALPCRECFCEGSKPSWEATVAGNVALCLEASLAAARAELERRKPEERVGECFCEPTSSRLRWLQHGRSFVCVEPCWINEDTDDTYPPGCFCPDCGAELGDGTARRNADTARVARVRDALATFPYRKDCGMGFSELQSSYDLATTIRIALDQEVPADDGKAG